MKELLTKAGNALLELAERMQEISESNNVKSKMKAPKIGDVIEIADMKWTVLDKMDTGFFCIAESIGNRKFGNNNNWQDSSIRVDLEELARKIEKEIGEELPCISRNLLSLDGQTEYGTCVDKVSLLDVDEYRKYRKLLPNTDKWWWLINSWSTKCNDDETWVTVVSPSGNVIGINFSCSLGVRPVCIFSSSIFESEEE